jgi:hypothetical protein
MKLFAWSREFIVMAIERLSAILPEDETCNSGIGDGLTGSKTISGTSPSWNHRRRIQEYEMHLSNNHYHTQYSSYHLSGSLSI